MCDVIGNRNDSRKRTAELVPGWVWVRVSGVSGPCSDVSVVKMQQQAPRKKSLKTRFVDGALPGSWRAVAAAAEAGRDRQVPGAPHLGSGPRGRGGGTSGSLETREGEVCAHITPRFLSATTDTQERHAPPRNQSPCSLLERLGRAPRTHAHAAAVQRPGRAPRRTQAAVHGHAPYTAQRGSENTCTHQP